MADTKNMAAETVVEADGRKPLLEVRGLRKAFPIKKSLTGKVQQELIAAGVLPKDYDFESHKRLVPMQPGDVVATYADVSELVRDTGFRPETSIRTGLRNFARWYREFYGNQEENK